MKNIIAFFLILILLISCNQKIETPATEQGNSFFEADTILLDTTTDYLQKASVLIKSTENAGGKVAEIKNMKADNTNLKKELQVTKQELKIAKEQVKVLDSALKLSEEKSKKGFIKRVIDNIKGDNDTIN